MKYTIYKITNKTNNKIYIGAHKTTNLDDGYMGSGTAITKAQEKYGIENFEKEILEVFETSEEMFMMESELVDMDFIKSDNTYNIALGGGGCSLLGIDLENRNKKISISMKKYQDTLSIEYKLDRVKKQTEIMRELYDSGVIVGSFTGRKHTDVTKEKMRISSKGNQLGEKNSQYGKIWIYNVILEETKKIEKSELASYKTNGWLKGRKLDWSKQRHIVCVICGVETNNRQTCSKECRKKLQTKQQELEYKKGVRIMGGENNPSFGSMWIHNLQLKVSKKIKKEELPNWEQDGWLKGRKIKF